MRVMLLLVRRRPTNPAACHEVPPPSWPCSSNTTSFQPSLVRWYATLVPMTPPPTMTTFDSVGRDWLDSIVGFVNARRLPARFPPIPRIFGEAIRAEALHIFLPPAPQNRVPPHPSNPPSPPPS